MKDIKQLIMNKTELNDLEQYLLIIEQMLYKLKNSLNAILGEQYPNCEEFVIFSAQQNIQKIKEIIKNA